MNDTLLFTLFTVIAFGLFVAEVFIPGGIIGMVGAVSLLTACGFAISAFGLSTGILISVLLIFITLGGFILWLIRMPDSKIGRRFSLQATLPSPNSDKTPHPLIGARGVAETDLRPSGFARINGKKMDVVTSRSYLEKGTELLVTEVHGSRVVVREASGVDA
ncbi:MAG: NfeD family protein [Kiritimatiellia bacterium]